MAHNMGIDLVLMLVDKECLDKILTQSWNSLYSQLEKGVMRELRPSHDPRLKRSFDIDIEAEILDWLDTITTGHEGSVFEVLRELENGCEGLLLLMQWASPGAWEVWEGRAYLYLDVALQRVIEDNTDLYSQSTWSEVFSRLNGLPEDEFSESVCLDWMERRKELGETLDESEDPKIVPTYEAHNRATRLFVHAVTTLHSNPDYVGILGREHLEPEKWGHGKWNLQNFLTDSARGSKTTP